MKVVISSPLAESKIAPKDMECSTCRATIKQGHVYVKTNGGRYCVPCADKMEGRKTNE